MHGFIFYGSLMAACIAVLEWIKQQRMVDMDKNACDGIQTLTRAVVEAQAAHATARQEEERARGSTTSALNRLNAAQKQLDAALADLRKDASYESDWKQTERRAKQVPCG